MPLVSMSLQRGDSRGINESSLDPLVVGRQVRQKATVGLVNERKKRGIGIVHAGRDNNIVIFDWERQNALALSSLKKNHAVFSSDVADLRWHLAIDTGYLPTDLNALTQQKGKPS